jgi:hypothetical protein
MLPNALDHRFRRRIRERIRPHDIEAVDRDAQLSEASLHAGDGERLVFGQLRRHPGGNEGLTRSDGTVVHVHATRRHRFGHTVPWFFGTELMPLYTNRWTRFPS